MFLSSFPEAGSYRQHATTANVVPVGVQILADMETPVSMLTRALARTEDCFLLESMENPDRWGRYSFLGLRARSRVWVYQDRVEIEEQGERRSEDHGGQPLQWLRRLMARYTPANLPELPRFYGGLVGWFCFEMVHFIEARVPNLADPSQPLAQFMIPEEVVVVDNLRHSLCCLALTFPQPGDDLDAVYRHGMERAQALADDMQEPMTPPLQQAPAGSDFHLQPIRQAQHYRDMVEAIKRGIVDGEVIQTVVAQAFECSAPDPIALYRALRYINPSPYMYFVRLDGEVLVGASPETMVRVEKGVATVRPIAGTRPRGADEQADRALADELLADEKEKAEHLMLVDLGRNDLGRVAATGTVQVTDLMFVERYSHVMHLVSNVEAQLNEGVDALDVFAATFPAGTLSGAPKVRAMELIAEQEGMPRGPYGGAVGYLCFSGDMDLAICIRTAHIVGDQMRVTAGAGIVADSDPERERMETVHKAGSLARALQLVLRDQAVHKQL
ncbi:MAG: anthranilate synthase component I family protein [Planctomycetota bacterium]